MAACALALRLCLAGRTGGFYDYADFQMAVCISSMDGMTCKVTPVYTAG